MMKYKIIYALEFPVEEAEELAEKGYFFHSSIFRGVDLTVEYVFAYDDTVDY